MQLPGICMGVDLFLLYGFPWGCNNPRPRMSLLMPAPVIWSCFFETSRGWKEENVWKCGHAV
jgi:hypothetical protein